MPSDVSFEDNSIRVKGALGDAMRRFLEEASGELEAQVKRNQTRVDTGATKNSWTHQVISDTEAVVGSNEENAIWEEYGTGEYALNGGRKGGWVYKSSKDGKFQRTMGKKPIRPLNTAFTQNKAKIQKRAEQILAQEMK